MFNTKVTVITLALSLLAYAGFTQKGRPAISEQAGKDNLAKFAATYHDKAGWEQRATLIRQNMLNALQLNPLPARTPLRPIIRAKKMMDGYTVENVAFESMPGFWVTGNLYKPINFKGKVAGILCPTGHSGKPARAREDADWQKLCASMAKMGAYVLAYDMIGYSESDQCTHTLPIAGKIHTWDSMRALDFLLTYKEVDQARLAVTGYSGGGTQTFILAALDKRIAVSAPVAMVSSYMYGGCVCESGMPIHQGPDIETNNAEIAALMAPRPMMVVSDGKDWTKNVPTVEFPYIKNVYNLYSAADKVETYHDTDGVHNYNFVKRKPVYAFFAKHLKLDISKIKNSAGEIDESFVTVQPYEQLTAFDAQNPKPPYAVKGDDAVMKLFASIK